MKKDRLFLYFIIYFWIGIFSTLVYVELLLGATNSISINKYLVHNVMICYLMNILIFNLFKKKQALLAISSVAFIWSIISHFVLQLHGSALCFSLFKNFKTAVTVIDHYNLSFDSRIIFIILLFLVIVAIVMLFPKKYLDQYTKEKNNLVAKILFVVVFVGYAVFSYSIAINNMSWAPFFLIGQRGYCSYLITDSIYCFNHYSKPDGYDESQIPTNLEGWEDNISDEYPDIILILNESYSDITKYSDVQTDVDPLEELGSIDNLTLGYCITPNAGGGTNTSEYELLTSNSTALLSIGAPFNHINFEKHNASVVPYLKKYQYSTYAFHCYSKENYNRKIAYPAMGFDNIYLGAEEYEYHSKNGNRDWLDQDNYNDLIRVYNESSDSPKFMYLLTYQNHGGYEQNPSEMDTVHSSGEYEISNDLIDEYESSIALSTQAFKELTDYFSTVDRPVIICMVGDHTISYSGSLNKAGASSDQNEIDDRTVPYLIWSNYEIDRQVFTTYTSMIDLVPSVLYAAGIELDDFYKQVLNMHEQMPGKTTFGMYVNNDGSIMYTKNDSASNDTWNKYLFAEYKRLTN